MLLNLFITRFDTVTYTLVLYTDIAWLSDYTLMSDQWTV